VVTHTSDTIKVTLSKLINVFNGLAQLWCQIGLNVKSNQHCCRQACGILE